MARQSRVSRPVKRSEYTIVFATRDAEKGWADLLSQIRNPLADAWDFLTRTPEMVTPHNYRLKGTLGHVQRNGVQLARWQHKPTLKGDARIWFYVEGRTVWLEQVHTSHPNQTK